MPRTHQPISELPSPKEDSLQGTWKLPLMYSPGLIFSLIDSHSHEYILNVHLHDSSIPAVNVNEVPTCRLLD